MYVDDAILIYPHKSLIDFEINSLRKYFDLNDDGELKDYLGTRFTKRKDASIELSQPRMVSCIISMVGLDPVATRVKMHNTPACDSKLLVDDLDGLPRLINWDY